MRKLQVLGAAIAVFALVASGCSGDDGDDRREGGGGSIEPAEVNLADLELAASLQPFDSCDALLAWIKAEALARVGPWGLGGGGYYGPRVAGFDERGGDDADVAASAPTADLSESAGDGGPSFSGTNVQVEGVDEPDIVKTDGRRIVVLHNGTLQLVDATVDPPAVLDSLDLDSWGGELLLSGDRALVLSGAEYRDIAPLGSNDIALTELTGSKITEVDLTGNELRVADEITFEGQYVSARMIGDVVRIVVQSNPEQRLGFVYPANEGGVAEVRAEAANRAVIEESTIDDWLPHVNRNDEEQNAAVACESTHRPQSFSGFGITSVLTVDLSEGLAAGAAGGNGTAVMTGSGTVYASPSHLYVATQEWVDWEALDESDRVIVDENFATAIHRFDITDPERAEYEASGRVDGTLLNQFAMDEKDDVLRVATTTGSPWREGEGESQSQVVTMGVSGNELVQLGKVDGLGRGETIHSVRYIGDTAYVVTFEQTDPLYTVDLSDPAAPAVVGELKILGYSAYLHPVADGFLLGVGQDADEDGRTIGTQVALFDVRDPAAPTRVAQAVIPDSSSGAEWDHHAFLWWAESNLAVIPVSTYDSDEYQTGAIGFRVDIDGATVTEAARISHPELSEDGGIAEPTAPPEEIIVDDTVISTEPYEYRYVPPIIRSFVIDDALWTLSDAGLMRSDLATLAPGPFLNLTTGN